MTTWSSAGQKIDTSLYVELPRVIELSGMDVMFAFRLIVLSSMLLHTSICDIST